MTNADIRRENLRVLVEGMGGRKNFSAITQRSLQQISDLLTGRASFGEKIARSIEQQCGIAARSLDEGVFIGPDYANELNLPSHQDIDDEQASQPQPAGKDEHLDPDSSGATPENASIRGLTPADPSIPATGAVVPVSDLRRFIPMIDAKDAHKWPNASIQTLKQVMVISAAVQDGAFAIPVTNDTMVNPVGVPSIPPGSMIVVDCRLEPEDGRFALVQIAGAALPVFGKLVLIGNKRRLQFLNLAYQPIDLTEDDRIIGRVVHTYTGCDL